MGRALGGGWRGAQNKGKHRSFQTGGQESFSQDLTPGRSTRPNWVHTQCFLEFFKEHI